MRFRTILFIGYLISIVPIIAMGMVMIGYNDEAVRSVEAADDLHVKCYQLQAKLSNFFNSTKNYLLIKDEQELQNFKTEWGAMQASINEPLNYIYKHSSWVDSAKGGAEAGKTGIDSLSQYNLELILSNLDIGREAADNIISDNNLLRINADSNGKRQELNSRIALNLQVLDSVQTKIDLASNNIVNQAQINLDKIEMMQEIRKKELNAAFIFILVLCTVFFLFISILVSVPLKRITRLFNDPKNKKLEFYSIISEVADLKKAFGKLMAEISSSTITAGELEQKVKEKTAELEKKNQELEQTLDDFYTMRISMQRQLSDGTVEEENKKIKQRMDAARKKK